MLGNEADHGFSDAEIKEVDIAGQLHHDDPDAVVKTTEPIHHEWRQEKRLSPG